MAEKPKKSKQAPKPGTTQRSGGGGNTNPTQPPKKPGG